jgi:branched-chain amino acid transport system substrate-binding protein
MKGFKLTGGEVVDQIWVPLDTADYAPYMAKLAPYAGKVDRLWSTFSAADAIRFINQYAEYGLKDKIKIFCENGLVDESSLPSEGESALGVEGYMHYAFSLDIPENRKFVSTYQKKHGEDPGILAEAGYTAAKAIVAGLQAVKGNIENQDAFLKALRNVKFQTARGPFSFDEHQNAIENVYILRVEKRGGKYNNYVIDTIPDVGQYWMPPKAK